MEISPVDKTKISLTPLLFPHPTVIVGVHVNGVPDFVTIAWITVACGTPPWFAFALNGIRYSMKGIRENMTFSVNIPDTQMVKETDYCGIATGAKNDKTKECGFDVFYGDLESAPFIRQCPVNIGCGVEHINKLGSHYLISGKAVDILVSNDRLTDGKPDAKKIDPIVYMTYPAGTYNSVGGYLGDAFKIGKGIENIEDDWDRQLATDS